MLEQVFHYVDSACPLKTVPNYCDISVARLFTDSSHSGSVSLSVPRQVIRGQQNVFSYSEEAVRSGVSQITGAQ